MACGCGFQAKWYTSTKSTSKGERFLRCSQSGGYQCEFFLWEKYELNARKSKTSENQTTPRTPTGTAVNSGDFSTPASHEIGNSGNRITLAEMLSLATPDSRDHTLSRSKSPREKLLPLQDASPTPYRFTTSQFSHDSKTDLCTTVIQLLHSQNIELESATMLLLRHKIKLEVDIYETKLQNCEETIVALTDKLSDLKNQK